MGFEANILGGKSSEFAKVIRRDFGSKISTAFAYCRIRRRLSPFENPTLRVREGSAAFNTEQCAAASSSVRNLSQQRSELAVVLSDQSKDVKGSVCHFYAFPSGLRLLWEVL